MTGRRVLVCGGRNYSDWERVYDLLDRLHRASPFSMLIHGADTLAGEWAASRYVPVEEYPAEWAKYGRRAGVMRNKQMLKAGKPELVVAFPGSWGTANMVRLAAAVPLVVIRVSLR